MIIYANNYLSLSYICKQSQLHFGSSLDFPMADKSILLVESPTECHLLPDARAHRQVQLNLDDVLQYLSNLTSMTLMILPGVYVEPTLNFNVSPS